MFCNCLHPKFFLNPSFRALVAYHGNYHLGKDFYYNLQGDYFLTKPLNKFYKLLHHITLDNIDNYYIDGVDGYKYPIFMASPCGSCSVCVKSKHNSIVRRLQYESQLYNYRPWFLTLTYNDSHLPEKGVSVRDCQLFFKRFRQNLIRNFGQSSPIRYYLVSEYGQDPNFTLRPHYHAIIFNLQPHSNADKTKLRKLIESSWHNGFCKCREIDMRQPTVFYYTSKYLNKDIKIPDGSNPTFSLSSRGKGVGGIGSPFIRQFSSCVFNLRHPVIKYTDKFTGRCKDLVLDKYVLNKLLPTFNTSVKVSLRNRCNLFSYLFTRYQYFDIVWNKFQSLDLDIRFKLEPYTRLLRGIPRYPLHHQCFSCICNILNAVGTSCVSELNNLNLPFLNQIHYARKDLLEKLLSSLVSPSRSVLSHQGNLFTIKENVTQQKKLLHYV